MKKLLMSSFDAAAASAAIIVACSIFILGHHQTLVSQVHVHAFEVGPTIIRHVSYRNQQYRHQHQRQRALISIDEVEASRKIGIVPARFGTTRALSPLFMNTGGDGEGGRGESSLSPSPSINIQLVLQNFANQALIGCQIWTGGVGYTVLSEQSHFGPGAIIFGIAGVIPMLALSRAIETSESPLVSGLNLSTNMAVLRLFGPTPQPISALLISLLIATSTGIVEETVFRGQALPAFAAAYGNGDVLIGALLSTLLFAALHTNPLSFFKGGEAFIDNFVLFILQIINGGIFAFLYLITGNLAVPIITHALYDLYTFYKTHLIDVAGQMEYAEAETLMPICSSNAVEKKWITERGEDWLKNAKQSFYLMDTNRDGELSRKELRVALYSYGVNLTKVQSEQVEQVADINESGLIDFDEYLEFVGPAGSRYKAVRNTLFGPT